MMYPLVPAETLEGGKGWGPEHLLMADPAHTHPTASDKTHVGFGEAGNLLVPISSTMTVGLESGAKWPRSGSPLRAGLPDSHVKEEALHSCLPLC